MSVIIDDCPACGAMNARAAGEDVDCRDCGKTIQGREIYVCVNCGATLEAPPGAAMMFESPIQPNDCDVCEFSHPKFIDFHDVEEEGMNHCANVSVKVAEVYPPGTLVCRQCGAIVPPETCP